MAALREGFERRLGHDADQVAGREVEEGEGEGE